MCCYGTSLDWSSTNVTGSVALGVVADAKPGAIAFYGRYGFVPLEGVREGALHGEPTPMFLAISTIAQSGGV